MRSLITSSYGCKQLLELQVVQLQHPLRLEVVCLLQLQLTLSVESEYRLHQLVLVALYLVLGLKLLTMHCKEKREKIFSKAQ